ncbi:hypothetical protein SLE2022_328030 [Rubroshorea leprosula]
MIGNGSAGFRLRWIWTQGPPSQRRCLRIPARCSTDVTAQYAMLGLTPLASKSDVKRASRIEVSSRWVQRGRFSEKDKAFREIKSADEVNLIAFWG